MLGHQRTGSAGVEPSKMTAREIRDLEKEKDHLIDRREVCIILLLKKENYLRDVNFFSWPSTSFFVWQ